MNTQPAARRTRSFLMSLLIAGGLVAQDFHPYPPATSCFHTEWQGSLSTNWDVSGYNALMRGAADTLIDGALWQEVIYHLHTEFWAFDSTYIGDTWARHSHMLCDSTGTTWVRWPGADTASIWFDPSIQPGDTVPDDWFIAGQSDWRVLSSIDTMFEWEGEYRDRYIFQPLLEFVEGIGYVTYPVLNWEVQFLWDAFDEHSFSYHADGSQGGEPPCTPLALEVSRPGGDLSSSVRIIGDPLEGSIRLSGVDGRAFAFAVHSVSGGLVHSGKLAGNVIGLPTLPSGMYFLRLAEEDGHGAVLPFVIDR